MSRQRMLKVVAWLLLILLAGCAKTSPYPEKPSHKILRRPIERRELMRQNGFCGRSSFGQCESDSDCRTAGCSGQICQSKIEEAIMTTCEYRECYNAEAYNMTCGCLAGQCQWVKEVR